MGMPSSANAATVEVRPWFETIARAGFAAKGLLYLCLAAVVLRGDIAAPGPGTRVLLAALSGLLIAAAVYKIVEMIAHPDVSSGRDVLTTRIGRAVQAAAYAGLAVDVLVGLGPATPHDEVHWSAHFLNQPLGPPLVVLVGLVIVGFGSQQVYRARSGDCVRRLDRARMGSLLRRMAGMIAATAYLGRALAYGIVGMLIIHGAVSFDARSDYRGLAGVFEALTQSTRGLWTLRTLAIGLLLYGAFCLALLAPFFTLSGTSRSTATRTSRRR